VVLALAGLAGEPAFGAPVEVAPLGRPAVLLARAIENDDGSDDIGTNLLRIEGGAIVTGWTSKDGGAPDGLLLRVDDQGEVLWRRVIGGAGTDLLWSVMPDDSAGYRCTGFSGSLGAGSLDGWMVAVSDRGEVRWQKTYGGAGEDRLTAIEPTPDGFIAVGQTSGRGAGERDALVVRMDRAGNERSSWTDGGPHMDRAFGIEPLEDGGCVIAGMTGETHETSDAFVSRLGSDGRRLWTRRIERPGFGVAHDLHRLANGDLLAIGYAHVDARRGIDGFAMRITTDGRVVWERTFGGSTYDRVNHAQVFADGSSMVVGYSQRPGAVDEETHWDLALYALDPAGHAVWSGRFGGDGVEFGRMVAGPPHDLWVIGHSSSGRAGSGVYLVRLDASGVVGGAPAAERP
jgi:hypothetical protein